MSRRDRGARAGEGGTAVLTASEGQALGHQQARWAG